MKVCIFGLWHLGTVTAACVAEHFSTVALDSSSETIRKLQSGEPPIFEPGLAELVQSGLAHGQLSFTTDLSVVTASDIVWVTFDTPVNEADQADSAYVERQICSLFPHLRDGSIVLISSQMPAGSTRRIEDTFRALRPNTRVSFAYSPENLRLGKALDSFRHPSRIVIGTRGLADRAPLEPLLAPFSRNQIYVSVESAEMIKHALNAFLATSVAFINEVAGLCEQIGADAKEVERGLKSDERIGPKAYLAAGGPFAGGTLARDISFLTTLGHQWHTPTPLLEAVRVSNDRHKGWMRRKLEETLGTVKGKNITILGLTYKPGTDTLRRSAAIELCRWLTQAGANVRAFDPVVNTMPPGLDCVELANSAAAAVQGADAVVLATEWPDFRALRAEDFLPKMRTPIIIDANRFLEQVLGPAPSLQYLSVGRVSTMA